MYVVEPNREHSKAQHSTAAQSPLHKAANQVPVNQSTHQRNMYVHVRCVPFVFLEHGALGMMASRLFAPKMLYHLLYYCTSVCHSDPCFFVSERSGRNRCTGIQQQQFSSSMYEYVCCR